MFRKIYMIEAYSKDGDHLMTRFAANMRTAERIAKPYGDLADIRLTGKDEWAWINPQDIERIQGRA